MDRYDQHINWDKLEEQLDGSNLHADPPLENITEEEKNIMGIAGKIQTTMKKIDPEKKFPASKGWERLQAALSAKEVPVIKTHYNIARWLAAAAMFTAVGVIVFFLMNRKTAGPAAGSFTGTADQIEAPNDIKLVLGNGETIELTDEQRIIKDNTGKEIVLKNTTADFSRATGAPVAAQPLNTIKVPRGRTASLILADGTKIWLNAASVLKFPSVFSSGKREVLLNGEAYFEVAQNKDVPFLVTSGAMAVRVLGTRFNADCYTHEQRITLVQGSVKVAAGNDSVLLKPGEAAEYNLLQRELGKKEIDPQVYTAWKDGFIVADQLSLKQIAAMLERSFDCSVHFEDASLQQLHFTLNIPKPDRINDVLDLLSQSTTGLKFTVNGKNITVSSN